MEYAVTTSVIYKPQLHRQFPTQQQQQQQQQDSLNKTLATVRQKAHRSRVEITVVCY